MNLKIRKATLKDSDIILSLWQEFRDNHNRSIFCQDKELIAHTTLKKNAKELFLTYLEDQINSKDSFVQLAFVDDEIAGYSLSFVKENIPVFTLEDTGHIGDLFIKKEFRGIGISTKFKENAFNWFKQKKIKYASIQVYPQNIHAHNIYKKWGFKDFHVEMRKKLE